MRDPRYIKTKDISEVAPEWAHGCPACKFGIVVAPDIVSVLPLAECRAVQAAEEMILFCDCRAGHMNRQGLRKIYATIDVHSKQNFRAIVLAANVPTVHAEGQLA